MRQAVAIAFAVSTVLTVGLSVGFTQLSSDAQARLDDQRRVSADAASVWQERISQQLYSVVSTAFSLGGFASSVFTHIPPHNSTNKTERMQFVSPTRFDVYCGDLNANIPGLLSLQLQASGVITQAYPPGSAPIGLDLLNHPTQYVDVYRAIERGGTVVAGPFELFQGGQGIIVRYPVFSELANKTIDTWWGNSAVVMRVREFLEDIGIAADVAARGQHYALWFVSNGARVVMGNSTGADVDKLESDGEVRRITLPNGNFWTLATMPRDGFDSSLSGSGVGLTVGLTMAAAVLVVALLAGGFLWYARVTRSTANAPTDAPLCLLFTDIESSTQLWAAAPDEMPDVLALHGELIRAVIKEHGGYEVKTIGDSFMIATTTAAQALNIATGIQAKLVATSWPATIQHFYDCDYLRVRIGVHYCAEVSPIFDDVSKGYDYFGNDVNYAARVESMAMGGEVLVSSEIEKHARDAFSFTEMGRAALKGIEGPQPLYRLGVPGLINRRERIADADLAAAAAASDRGDESASSFRNDSASSDAHSVRSDRYGQNFGEDSHAVPELAFSAIGSAQAVADPAMAQAVTAMCQSHHEALCAVIAPFKGAERAALVKSIAGKFGIPLDAVAVARLAVRTGLICYRRSEAAAAASKAAAMPPAGSATPGSPAE